MVLELERRRRKIEELQARVANQADTIRNERLWARHWRDAYQHVAQHPPEPGQGLSVEHFPRRLMARRLELNLSQREVGDAIGRTHAQVWTWETGRISPNTRMLPGLCAVLRVHSDWLLGGA